MTMETQPFGVITSFTKNAVSEIIGPQAASYQPTEPSSNGHLQVAVVVLVGRDLVPRAPPMPRTRTGLASQIWHITST